MLDFMEVDRAFIAEKDARISELEAEISALQRSIALLEEAKQPVQERLDLYKYPVLTLPPEIVTEVFLHFLPTTYPEAPPLVGLDSPTILAHICRQWREIALSISALWRAVAVALHRGKASLARVAWLAPTWLERSGCLPVSITASDADDLFPVFSSLIPHCHRWEHLKLTLESTDNIDALNVPMPLLCSLDIYLSNEGRSVPLNLETLPLLRTVILDDFGSPSVILPWLQLTSLTLRSLYPSHCMTILCQTEQLEYCALSFWDEDDPQKDFVDLLLPRLETLVFERESRISVQFFHSLVAPALLRLQFRERFLGELESDRIASLKSFITKSGCKLQELQITRASSLSEATCREVFPSIADIII